MNAFLLENFIIPVWQLLKKQKINLYLKEYQKSQWFDKSELEIERWVKLKNLIYYCELNVPYYRNMFAKIGITSEDINELNDFKRIPILTKEIFRKNYRDFIPDNNFNDEFGYTETSGSTGISMRFHISKIASERWYASKLHWRILHGVYPGDPILWIWGRKLKKKSFIHEWVKNNIFNEYRFSAFDITEKNALQIVELIKKKKIKSIYGYSSAVYEFSKILMEKNISLPMKKIFVTAESIYDNQKTLIEEVFQCSVISEYGAAEMGILSFECEKGSKHIIDENVLLEELEIDEHNNLKKIIVTEFFNYAMPLLRYDSGDLTSGISNEICLCGRGHNLLSDVVGRQYDLIKLKNGRVIHGEMINYLVKGVILKYFPSGCVHQFLQESHSSFILQLAVANIPLDQQILIKNELVKGFVQLTGVNYEFKLDVIFCDLIARPNTGKHRYIVSKVE